MTGSAPDPEVLLAHGDFLRGLARSLVDDRDGAEDAVQQTWLLALSRPPRRPGVRAWLARVLRNVARNARRDRRRRQEREVRALRAEGPLHVPSASEIVQREELRRLVVQAVLELDEPFRTAVLLRWFEGREPGEIARGLGVPAATVRTRLHRALSMLRGRLDAAHGGDRKAWAGVLLPVAAGARRTAAAGMATSVLWGATMKKLAFALAAVLLCSLVWVMARPTLPVPGAMDAADAAPFAAPVPVEVGEGRVAGTRTVSEASVQIVPGTDAPVFPALRPMGELRAVVRVTVQGGDGRHVCARG